MCKTKNQKTKKEETPQRPPFYIQGGDMELWELVAQLCKTVVDNENVFLEILITPNGWDIHLMPIGDNEED